MMLNNTPDWNDTDWYSEQWLNETPVFDTENQSSVAVYTPKPRSVNLGPSLILTTVAQPWSHILFVVVFACCLFVLCLLGFLMILGTICVVKRFCDPPPSTEPITALPKQYVANDYSTNQTMLTFIHPDHKSIYAFNRPKSVLNEYSENIYMDIDAPINRQSEHYSCVTSLEDDAHRAEEVDFMRPKPFYGMVTNSQFMAPLAVPWMLSPETKLAPLIFPKPSSMNMLNTSLVPHPGNYRSCLSVKTPTNTLQDSVIQYYSSYSEVIMELKEKFAQLKNK